MSVFLTRTTLDDYWRKNMKNEQIPIARKDGLVVQETDESVLVYDLDTNKAHCLNETAAFIWKVCDGRTSVADITALFEDQTGKNIDENLIWLAIDQLSDKDLLVEPVVSKLAGQNRREVIKKIGLGAVIAVPIVASLSAPTSVLAAASCACVNPIECIPQATCASQVNCAPTGICST